MAKIKVSQLSTATRTYQSDQFMVVQNTTNKKLTLQALLSHLDSPVVINSNLENLNLIVNGTQPNLIFTNASTNSVGILTNNPLDSALHVSGDVRVGGYSSIDRTIFSVVVGANDSGGTGYKTITCTILATDPDITGVFNANDVIYITGLNVADLNGYKVIGNDTNRSFKYNVPNLLSTVSLNTSPPNSHAQKITFSSGVFKSSIEQLVHDSGSGTKTIGSNFSISGLNINGPAAFGLALTGGVGQEKYIYLKSISNSGDKATIDNINGSGFNRIQLTQVGNAVTLSYDGEKWICLGVNGATVSTV